MSIGSKIKMHSMEAHIPFLAGLELTNQCNLRCRYCYVDKNAVSEMSFSLIEATLDKLRAMGTRVIVLTGGEIFMREDISDIIRLVESRKILMVLYTNGTIPLEPYREILESNWILRIELTIYGASEETYSEFCGNGLSYRFLEDNIKLLKELNKRVLIKVVPTKYNMKDIEKIKDMISNYGFEININTLVVNATDGCRSCILDDRELKRIVNGIKDDANVNKRDTVEGFPTRVCGAGRYSLCIDYLGNLKACFISSENAGNISHLDIEKSWTQSEYFIKRQNFREPSTCIECPDRPFCFACTEILMAEGSTVRTRSSELCRQAMIRKDVFYEKNV